MHDAEDQDGPILVDDVVHHAVVAGAQAMKDIAGAMDRLHGLAGDAARLRCVSRELRERSSQLMAPDVRRNPSGHQETGSERDDARRQ